MKIKQIAIDAMLAAMCVVLGYVSLDVGSNFKFTFESFPILVGALLFGPVNGMLIGTVGTFISQVLKYGLEASTILWIIPYAAIGLFVGFFCKKKLHEKNWKLFALVIIAGGLIVTLLNTVGLYIYYKYILLTYKPVMILAPLPLKLLISVIKSVVFAIVLPIILKAVKHGSRE